MFAGFGAAEDTNARFRQLLAAGQTGLSIAYDMPTLYGYDTDDPEAEGEFGTCGVAVSSLADMEVLLDGLPLDRVATSMTINSPAAPIWAMYIAAAEKRGVPRAALEGTLQNDILKEFVAQKEFLFPPEPSMRLVTDTIEFGTREMPRWNTISISGYHIREAGSTAVQELAFTIADGMAYVEAALARGLRVDDFAPRLSLLLQQPQRLLRGDRQVPGRAPDLVQADDRALSAPRTSARPGCASTPRRPACRLTAQQPLNNLTRVAIQALAAVLGGTQSLHTDAYDEAWAVPSAEAALLALRQQQIIAEETGVANTVDPLGGSWFVEALTNETEAAVWRYLDEIDRRGGMVAAIAEGYPAARDRRRRLPLPARARRRRARDRRGQPLRRPGRGRSRSRCSQVPEASLRAQLARLERTRRERDGDAVEAALAGFATLAARPGSSETNLMPRFIDCAAPTPRSASMCGVLRVGLRGVPRARGRLRRAPAGPGRIRAAPRWPTRPATIGPCISMPSRSSRTSATAGVPFEALDELTDDQLDADPSRRPTAGPAAT